MVEIPLRPPLASTPHGLGGICCPLRAATCRQHHLFRQCNLLVFPVHIVQGLVAFPVSPHALVVELVLFAIFPAGRRLHVPTSSTLTVIFAAATRCSATTMTMRGLRVCGILLSRVLGSHFLLLHLTRTLCIEIPMRPLRVASLFAAGEGWVLVRTVVVLLLGPPLTRFLRTYSFHFSAAFPCWAVVPMSPQPISRQ